MTEIEKIEDVTKNLVRIQSGEQVPNLPDFLGRHEFPPDPALRSVAAASYAGALLLKIQPDNSLARHLLTAAIMIVCSQCNDVKKSDDAPEGATPELVTQFLLELLPHLRPSLKNALASHLNGVLLNLPRYDMLKVIDQRLDPIRGAQAFELRQAIAASVNAVSVVSQPLSRRITLCEDRGKTTSLNPVGS